MKSKNTILLVSLIIIIAFGGGVFLTQMRETKKTQKDIKPDETYLKYDTIQGEGDCKLCIGPFDSVRFVKLKKAYLSRIIGYEYGSNTEVQERNIEKAILIMDSMYAKRKDSTLILKIGESDSMVFTDFNDTANFSAQIYSLIDYNKTAGYYILSESWYEGGTWYIINQKTGKKIESKAALPLFSPGSKFISCIGSDMEGQTKVNFKIYKVEKDGLSELINFNPTFLPQEVVWIDNYNFDFSRLEGDTYKQVFSKGSLKFK